MNEERKLILKMLEEGKIDSEEASKLLDAIKDTGHEGHSNKKSESIIDSKKLTKSLENLGSSITDTVFNIVDGFKNIDLSAAMSGNYERLEKNITEDISSIKNPIIDLSAINGYINVDKVDSDSLMIKIDCQYRENKIDKIDELFNFSIKENLIKFEPTIKARDTIINLNVLLPAKDYKNTILFSTNGNIQIKKLNSENLKLTTTNGNVDVSNMNINETTINSTNGQIYIDGVDGTKLDLLTTNGSIDLTNIHQTFVYAKSTNASIKGRNIKTDDFIAKTSNGRIITDNLDCKLVELKSTNSSITSNIVGENKKGRYDLSTSFGNINLNKSNLTYDINDLDKPGAKRIVAKDKDFDTSNKQIDVNISTTHGSISIE